ncbi:hypothetical protein V493_07158 [Pseudogymnoascus sp. VKM F-4281 (FW-2241)]|nr:hypothetical protein V493_07158 [Pseudogymnoascus sp. VKM F-4281 (FW-2241)]
MSNFRIVIVSKPGATPESVDSQEADSQPAEYPTFAELFSSNVVPRPTLDAVRLVQSFGGSLETSLSVMATAYNTEVLEPYDPEKDEDPPHLLKCCYTERPRHKEGGVLVTPSASGQGFVTVHDYVTTMHPWLMRNRGDILDAMNRYEDMPDAEHMDLVVGLVTPNCLTIIEKSKWVREVSMRREGTELKHVWPQEGRAAIPVAVELAVAELWVAVASADEQQDGSGELQPRVEYCPIRLLKQSWPRDGKDEIASSVEVGDDVMRVLLVFAV